MHSTAPHSSERCEALNVAFPSFWVSDLLLGHKQVGRRGNRFCDKVTREEWRMKESTKSMSGYCRARAAVYGTRAVKHRALRLVASKWNARSEVCSDGAKMSVSQCWRTVKGHRSAL